MEYLALEVYDLPTADNPRPTQSQFANLPSDTTITINRTSRIFGSGEVWTHTFRLNAYANAHIFGTAGTIHGSRLHEQVDKRRARLWVMGLPLYYGQMRLDNEVDMDDDGDIEVRFESGRKIFDNLIEGMSARDVSVGDVKIGVALYRKRHVVLKHSPGVDNPFCEYTLEGLEGLIRGKTGLGKYAQISYISHPADNPLSSYRTQMWPKLVNSQYRPGGGRIVDFTNVQTPYDAGHPFCNINICYPFKYFSDNGNGGWDEKSARGYILRLAHGEETANGGDNQTRYNNAPNFYLLYWLDRLMEDLQIHIAENQALDVEDLRRVFMLNWGCHYDEIDTDINENIDHTPDDKETRYGRFSFPLGGVTTEAMRTMLISEDDKPGLVLARNLTITQDGVTRLEASSVPGTIAQLYGFEPNSDSVPLNASGYYAYATSDNYPNVDASEVIKAMEAAFGIRLLFNDDFSTVRIVLLRNIFSDTRVMELHGDIISEYKSENGIRGFRMTYGQGKDDTAYYYKGFDDLMPHYRERWPEKDTHDYSQWGTFDNYASVKTTVSSFNRRCYIVTPTANAYLTKVDEDEKVLFPSLFEVAQNMDAEDGDCTSEDAETVEEVSVGATPLEMNNVNGTYAAYFSGDMKAPAAIPDQGTRLGTPMYACTERFDQTYSDGVRVQFDVDIYINEGYQVFLKDNYDISGDGESPFDTEDPGLVFGIMRGSGSDAYVQYLEDTREDESNDYWEAIPGNTAIAHPDTCDDDGNEWDYSGKLVINTQAEANAYLFSHYAESNYDFAYPGCVIDGVMVASITDNEGVEHRTLMVFRINNALVLTPEETRSYPESLNGLSIADIMAEDSESRQLIIALDGTQEECKTIVDISHIAQGFGGTPYTLYNGIGSRYGRFSLKLRAEKPNPFYDASQPESDSNRPYLSPTNKNLRGRGLCDQFYKAYSYWRRNARIYNARMSLDIAQISTIDDTVKLHAGDVTGLFKQLQYTVNIQTGLGPVDLQIMYI